jgi:molybdopterin molybdotransferase
MQHIICYEGETVLYVKTPEEVLQIIRQSFSGMLADELIEISEACGRILAADVVADEYVPDFNRSTVDGYALQARDTFGCSESIPAILPLAGEIQMGSAAPAVLQTGTCMSVPTGGDVPDGADAVTMLEYTEDYGDGTIGVTKPAAPGENMIYRGDDVTPGDTLLRSGCLLEAHHIGALAALGVTQIRVRKKPVVGIISTGDELVGCSEKPNKGQIRDVNTMLLAAFVTQAGGISLSYGILRDDEALLNAAVLKAVSECDAVLISGGSSVGAKDATARVIERHGSILLHGIAMKPGKPTILGDVGKKPVFGLPGHPVAAYFVSQLFVRPLISRLLGSQQSSRTVTALLGSAISSNHGRAEYIGVRLESASEAPVAHPVHGKSGLITILSGTDGYICIPRDCEGLKRNSAIQVTLWH